MAKPGWQVRRSQLVTTYGVGAMVTVDVESVMVSGIDRWPPGEADLHEPRLERELRVEGFRRPPASDDGPDIPTIRFPSWVFCPTEGCDTGLGEHDRITRPYENTCPNCDEDLVPSRFVIACRRGHIDDFPYFAWVHAGSRPDDSARRHRMRIESSGASAALRDIVVHCSCGKSATMDGAFGRSALRDIHRQCRGRRPWLTGRPNEDCDELPRVLQRGASNVWFPVVRSALSIPPWSDGVLRLLNRHWRILRSIPESAVRETLDGLGVHRGTHYTLDDVERAVAERKRRERGEDDYSDTTLRSEEFEALVRGRPESGPDDEFVCEPTVEVAEFSRRWFSDVMLVKRLVEVRALQSFTRILPPGPADPPEYRASLAGDMPHWLPAVEVKGEGVFLRLKEEALREWESRPIVRARVERLNERYEARFQDLGAAPERSVSPRLVLTHTLAHVLIGEWALDSGYPAASLRERLYLADEQAGLLIYTATSDSAGSLGGVLAQAEADRLEASLREALERAAWCSSDPLCVEAEAQGVDALNLAACHACVLLPEVSCEEMNILLDRALLVGTPEEPRIGFFRE